ncbi:DUF881 domain-containing protein [Aeromicrobium sp.]|uniref:DUF881 domain-containing protein n=1 Tax=Aeromicrobium sp. TaxID=1871063 RepID=UPI0019A9A25E|nr:DUF881 domain-containing protein [Aeromicrobium sp.]MBC7632346.1 DUF881 domain-containing protein [Aeromicrobium sp.]
MSEHDTQTQAEGLLEKIADTALDDDYYVVRAGPHEQAREFNTVLTALVLAVFALLIVMAAQQTRSDRPATERERKTLISDVAARKKVLAGREASAARLRAEVTDLSASVNRFDPNAESLRVLTADQGASGPGIKVTVSPSSPGNDDGLITDSDMHLLVNGLWYAGAEAVSINGQRIGTLTAIRSAGSAITVNFTSIGPPYTVVALGDSETMQTRFVDNPAGRYWASRKKDSGVRFDVTPSTELRVAAAPRARLTLRHARAIKGES